VSTLVLCVAPNLCNLPALQYVVVELPGVPALLLRVTATNTLIAEEQQDVLGYHCFRYLCDFIVTGHSSAVRWQLCSDASRLIARS
jgi:hypothetical protein